MKTNFTDSNRRAKGQTTIELALIMMLLLVLFFGIAEIARAWWLKNQINNAARVGVRVAIVQKSLKAISPTNCTVYTSPPADDADPKEKTVFAACSSITNAQLHDAPTTTVELTITDDVQPSGLSSGDTVRVTVKGDFHTVVPGLAGLSFGLFRPVYNMTSDAVMRYE